MGGAQPTMPAGNRLRPNRMPATISPVCTVWARISETNPATARAVPSSANRWAGCGGAGRPDNASTMGSLATARAGHHEAAIGVEHGKALAAALGLGMADWYQPTAAGYFGRIGKAAIIADLESIRHTPPAPAWLKLKKAELAALAEREAAQTRWLPVPLQ